MDDADMARRGPLSGVRAVEFAGIGPAPFAAMLLADMGAEVVRIARPEERRPAPDFTLRGKTCVALDLKDRAGIAAARALCARADVVIEGFRPGVMERLGLGPDALLADNPALVCGRMTGWGQTGPLAGAAGHDITYIAITGMLDAMGAAGRKPAIPLNLVGDLGGGAMFLVTGILAALLEAGRSGAGQVVDAAITDGVNLMAGFFHALRAQGRWEGAPGTNLVDGGAHFYTTYRCADGKYLALGPIEPQFYAELRRIAGLDDPAFDAQMDRAAWPDLQARLDALFATRTRDDWCAAFDGSEACVAPVLTLAEAPEHPHTRARGGFSVRGGCLHPAPAPRFSRTPGAVGTGRAAEAAEVLARWAGR